MATKKHHKSRLLLYRQFHPAGSFFHLSVPGDTHRGQPVLAGKGGIRTTSLFLIRNKESNAYLRSRDYPLEQCTSDRYCRCVCCIPYSRPYAVVQLDSQSPASVWHLIQRKSKTCQKIVALAHRKAGHGWPP